MVAKTRPNARCLELEPTSAASTLRFINRLGAMAAAKKVCSVVELAHAPATQAGEPWSLAAVVAARPLDRNLLGWAIGRPIIGPILNKMPGSPHSHGRELHAPLKSPEAIEMIYVQVWEFFDGQATHRFCHSPGRRQIQDEDTCAHVGRSFPPSSI